MLIRSDRTPKLLPAYRNLAWNISADLTHDAPVLVSLELKTRSSIDLFELGTPYNSLLRKTLQYISSLPETRVHCGQAENVPSITVLLIELPHARRWQDLMISAGMELLLSMLGTNPVYHCVVWEPSASFMTCGRMELMTFNCGTVAERRFAGGGQQFAKTWADFSEAVSVTDACNVHGNWAEAWCMANLHSENPSGRRAAIFAAWDEQPATFCGLLHGPAPDDAMGSLALKFTQCYGDGMSRRVVQLQPWSDWPPPMINAPQPSLPPIFHPVEPTFRRPSVTTGNDEAFRSHYYALRKIKSPDHPEPRGGYHPLGTINQYSMPVGFEPVAADTRYSRPADTLRMKLQEDAGDVSLYGPGELSTRLADFVNEITALKHCEALYWARRHDDRSTIVFIIIWTSFPRRPESLPQVFRSLLQQCMVWPYVEEQPHLKSFPINTSALTGLLTAKHLELITFRTSNDPEMKRLLRIHVDRFSDTGKVAGVVVGRTSAGRCINSSFAEEAAEYICLWSWQSLEARKRWYEQFRTISASNFERLGHIVTGIQCVATRGIDSELLEMQTGGKGFSSMGHGVWRNP